VEVEAAAFGAQDEKADMGLVAALAQGEAGAAAEAVKAGGAVKALMSPTALKSLRSLEPAECAEGTRLSRAEDVKARTAELLVPDEEAAALASGKRGGQARAYALRAVVAPVSKLKSNWMKNWKRQWLRVDTNGVSYSKQLQGQNHTLLPLDRIVSCQLAARDDVGAKVKLKPETFIVRTRDERVYVFAPEAPEERTSDHPTQLSGRQWCEAICSHVLVHAVQNNMTAERVSLFCELGANVNAAQPDGRQYPSLALAMVNGTENVAKYLLRRGADPSCLLRWTFLMIDKVALAVEVLNLLIETKKDLNVCSDDRHGWTLLHYLAYEGDLESVQRLIARVDIPTIEAVNTLGDTSLMLALKRHGRNPAEHIKLLCLALAKNTEVTQPDRLNDTVLHLAIKQGHEQLAKFLVERGAKIEQRDSQGDTALHIALKTGAFNLSRWMVSRLHEDRRASVLNLRDEHKGDTVLVLAIKLQEEELALFLLQNDADPSITPNEWDLGKTCVRDSPLHIAVKMEMRELSQAIVSDHSDGEDLGKFDTNGVPLLVLALERALLELAVVIVRAYVRQNPKLLDAVAKQDGNSALHVALIRGWILLACIIIDGGADVNRQNKHGQAVVHLCVERLLLEKHEGYERIVLEFLKGILPKANLSLRFGPKELTCLHLSMSGSQIASAKLFLEHKSELVNDCDKYGNSALGLAVNGGNAELVELAILHKADVNLVNKKNLSTLHLAVNLAEKSLCEEGKEICKLLLNQDAYPGVWDSDGLCPLHVAVKRGRLILVEILEKHCTLPGHLDLRTEDGRTAAMLAVMSGHLRILKSLVDTGVDLAAKIPSSRRTIFHIAADLSSSKAEPFWSSGMPHYLLELEGFDKLYDLDATGVSSSAAKSIIWKKVMSVEGEEEEDASPEPVGTGQDLESLSSSTASSPSEKQEESASYSVPATLPVPPPPPPSPSLCEEEQQERGKKEEVKLDGGLQETEDNEARFASFATQETIPLARPISHPALRKDPELQALFQGLASAKRIDIVEQIKLEGKLVAQQWLTTTAGQIELEARTDKILGERPEVSELEAEQIARRIFVEEHLQSWFSDLHLFS